MRLAIGRVYADFINQNALVGAPHQRRTLDGMPEEKRPDLRPQLRAYLAWYEEVLARVESGAVVAPGEQELSLIHI